MAAPGQEGDQDQDDIGEKKIINRTFLPLSQITTLSEQNIEGVQQKLEEFLSFEQLKMSLKEAILLDYYTAGFWWAKEMNFSLTQLSGFMDLLNFMLENLSDKHMTLGDNLKELGKAMAGIGESDSGRSGDLNFFSIEQAKAVIDYLNIRLRLEACLNIIPISPLKHGGDSLVEYCNKNILQMKWQISLFKHYKLYEYLFHSRREELVISNEGLLISTLAEGKSRIVAGENGDMQATFAEKYVTELAQPAVPFFPPLLEGDIPSDSCSTFVSPSTAAETESKGSDQEGYLEEPCPEVESFEADAVAGVAAEDQKSTMGEISNETVGNLEAEINEKLQMQEGAYTLRTEKLRSPK